MNDTGKYMRAKFGMNRYELHKTNHTPKRKGKVFRKTAKRVALA